MCLCWECQTKLCSLGHVDSVEVTDSDIGKMYPTLIVRLEVCGVVDFGDIGTHGNADLPYCNCCCCSEYEEPENLQMNE